MLLFKSNSSDRILKEKKFEEKALKRKFLNLSQIYRNKMIYYVRWWKKANPLLHFILSKSLFYLKYTKSYIYIGKSVVEACIIFLTVPLRKKKTFISHFQILGLGVKPSPLYTYMLPLHFPKRHIFQGFHFFFRSFPPFVTYCIIIHEIYSEIIWPSSHYTTLFHQN